METMRMMGMGKGKEIDKGKRKEIEKRKENDKGKGKEIMKGKVKEKEKEAKPSNLENFIYSVTPLVPFEFVSKKKITDLNKKWYPCQREEMQCFAMNNFWDFYDDCSSYGLGVPLTLENGKRFTQYYLPTLSAMQIYTSIPYANDLSEIKEEADEMKMSDEMADRLGYQYFQFNESCNPFSRYPLMDKVTYLSKDFPGLMSLTSVDLSPASWLSVAWYPIYPIPYGIPKLSTCFLTYHTLSSSFLDEDTDATEVKDDTKMVKVEPKEGQGLRLSPFGMATHKLQGNIWIGGDKDRDTLVSMLGVADSWLKQLTVEHHDFNYFTGKYSG